MKKKALFVLLFAAAGVGLVCFFAALRTEQAHNDLVHMLGAREEARVLESQFERGLLASTSHIAVEFYGETGATFENLLAGIGAEGVRGRLGLVLHHEVEHGLLALYHWLERGAPGLPTLAEVESELSLDQESQHEVSRRIGRMPSLFATTRVGPLGSGETRLRMDRTEVRAEDGQRSLVFEGLEGALLFAPSFRLVEGRVHSPGGVTQGPERRIALENGSLQFEVQGGPGLTGSLLRMRASSVHWQTVEGGLAEWTGIDAEQHTRLDEERLTGELDVRVRAIAGRRHHAGPWRAQLGFREIDLPELLRMRRAIAEGDDADWDRSLAELADRTPQLRVIELEGETPEGPLRATGEFEIDRSARPLAGGLRQAWRGQLDVAVAADLVESLSKQAALPVESVPAEQPDEVSATEPVSDAPALVVTDGSEIAVEPEPSPEPTPDGLARRLANHVLETTRAAGEAYQLDLRWERGALVVNGRPLPAEPDAAPQAELAASREAGR